MEDFSGYFESSAKKKSSKASAARGAVASSRRGVASKSTCQSAQSRRSSSAHSSREGAPARSRHLRVRGTRPDGRQVPALLVSELLHDQFADLVASRRLHPVRVNYGRVRSARYVRASAICANEGPTASSPIFVSSTVKKTEFFSLGAVSEGNSLAK